MMTVIPPEKGDVKDPTEPATAKNTSWHVYAIGVVVVVVILALTAWFGHG